MGNTQSSGSLFIETRIAFAREADEDSTDLFDLPVKVRETFVALFKRTNYAPLFSGIVSSLVSVVPGVKNGSLRIRFTAVPLPGVIDAQEAFEIRFQQFVDSLPPVNTWKAEVVGEKTVYQVQVIQQNIALPVIAATGGFAGGMYIGDDDNILV